MKKLLLFVLVMILVACAVQFSGVQVALIDTPDRMYLMFWFERDDLKRGPAGEPCPEEDPIDGEFPECADLPGGGGVGRCHIMPDMLQAGVPEAGR